MASPHCQENTRALAPSIQQEGSTFGDTYVTGGVLVQGNVVINSAATARTGVGHYTNSSLHPLKTFVERPELREMIRSRLARDRADTSQNHKYKILAVWGLGGTGKTQLVLSYLQHHQTDYEATFWIDAGMKSTVERDFVNIYRLLYGEVFWAPKGGQDLVSEAVLRVKSWFGDKKHRWLLVFDGADSLDDPEDQDYVNLLELIPMSLTVDVIITSRSKTADDLSTLEGVHVKEMAQDQAVDLFYKSSELNIISPQTTEEVKCIVDELGHLALAVNLAGAYVRETPDLRSDLSKYLKEYRGHQKRRHELLGRKPNRQAHQYSESVLTTWETSFHAVNEQYPLAGRLLTILAFISHDDIYMALFGLDGRGNQAEHSDNETLEQPIKTWTNTISPEQPLELDMFEEGFRVLGRYSLVQWQGDHASYQMHRLVHAWGHDRLSPAEKETFGMASMNLMDDAMSRCSGMPQARLRLTPHIMTCFGVAISMARDMVDLKATARVVTRMDSFLDTLGQWSDVRSIRLFILEVHVKVYGKDHPSTISATNNLANTLRKQGQLEDAAKMMRDVLERTRRISGEEHPYTILAINNLAVILEEQGYLDEAAQMKKEALKKVRRIRGEEHPSTITAMNNLALTLQNQGYLDDAVEIMREALGKRRRILGEDHPHTISAMNNLASILGYQGHLDEPEKLMREVLEKRQRILGTEHPDTIGAISNLASALDDLGQVDEAAKMKKEVLEKTRRILGEDHPDTISAMHNLANTLGEQGQIGEAIDLLQTALQKMKQTYGDDHPHIGMASRNLSKLNGCLESTPGPTMSTNCIEQGPLFTRLDLTPEPTLTTKHLKQGWLFTRLKSTPEPTMTPKHRNQGSVFTRLKAKIYKAI
ncbi:hypothetical protein LTR84_009403 [Exophiala bonariae]|uniref:NB-ARC domain-containing protein n=1 Tax=Exophiala bonariae TaxID=1690606 RepID=A0AAV9MUZ1_9EURO|nr:hypothetical protein LTR84_009403 [Exophiala bonariae]